MRVKHLAILVLILASTTQNTAVASAGIDFYQQDFKGLASLGSFVEQQHLSNDDVLAECSAFIAAAIPLLHLGNAELYQLNTDIYLRLERSQGYTAKALVNEKTEKYIQSFSTHTTFTEKEALIRRASKVIMLCRGFYHSVS